MQISFAYSFVDACCMSNLTTQLPVLGRLLWQSGSAHCRGPSHEQGDRWQRHGAQLVQVQHHAHNGAAPPHRRVPSTRQNLGRFGRPLNHSITKPRPNVRTKRTQQKHSSDPCSHRDQLVMGTTRMAVPTALTLHRLKVYFTLLARLG